MTIRKCSVSRKVLIDIGHQQSCPDLLQNNFLMPSQQFCQLNDTNFVKRRSLMIQTLCQKTKFNDTNLVSKDEVLMLQTLCQKMKFNATNLVSKDEV